MVLNIANINIFGTHVKVSSIAILPVGYRHAIKECLVLLINATNFIQHHSFIYTQLNDSKYTNVSLIIQSIISHVYTLLIDQKLHF